MRALGATIAVVALAVVCVLPLSGAPGWAETHRGRSAPVEFQRLHPCPSGQDKGNPHYPGCRGWVIDHIVPLCKNGPDSPDNMQWQTVAAAKAKDRWECR